MQVFRLFLKLIKNTSTPIIILSILFILYLFLFMDKGVYHSVEKEEINVVVLNYNREDVLWEQLKSLLENYCRIYEYEGDKDLLDDKLSTLNIDAIISIPFGFSKDIIEGKEVTLELDKITNNKFIVYVEDLINLYLNTIHHYINGNENTTQEQIVTIIKSTFEITGDIKLISQRDTSIDYKLYEKYFKIAAYIVFTVCLIGIGLALHSFQNIHIQRRNLMSPLPDGFRNFQMFFGNLIFVVLYDIFLIVVSLIYYTPLNLDIYIVLFWINLIIFSISGLSISFLMAMLTKKREINIVIAVVIPLIMCFISGVFSSHEEVGTGLLNVAYFTPTYWFVKGNTTIMNAGYGQVEILDIMPILLSQLLFGIAIFCIALVISKEKRNKS